ncbi:hypothetical protein CDD81_6399 [Ophiocordyceps australis]|uniref:Capsule polysaccharide biosynthesis protein n=1 Tax=Ophiocordyceps australis TaxID=1399860 RepID=A0A2C5Y7N9_9HYPO|nr:hypothetical protein CDD81_6399 [Ophiocordyceps australis]
MASAASKMGGFTLIVRLLPPLALGSAGYAAWRINWAALIKSFVTGPGRTSRISLLLFLLLNWKNLPFAWTSRVFYAMIQHTILHKSPQLTPRALFKPMISETRAPLLEIDYNLHKSNSTYFTDLDVSRTHLVCFLCRPGVRNLSKNSQTRLVLDPATGKPAGGSIGIILGAVGCSFKREISAYKGYELWSRILSWDRKWMYIVTHFIPKGAARPAEWLDPRFDRYKTRGSRDPTGGWENKIHATAVSKYVFKLGRLTIHPAVILAESGLLPDRPDGWTSGVNNVGDESIDLSHLDLSVDGEWNWRRVEAQRREGMKLASQLQALDDAHHLFDGGSHGALAKSGHC